MRNLATAVSAMNTSEARNRNLVAVFEMIRESDGVSRTEIGARMPFSLQTVTSVCQELVAMGVIREGGRQQISGKGKPQTRLNIVPERGFGIGMQMRWNSISLCLINLGYEVVDEAVFAIGAFDPQAYVAKAIDILRTFIARHAGKDIWGLSISGPLPVDLLEIETMVPRPFNWQDGNWFRAFWKDYSINSFQQTMEQALQVPVSIMNNPQSAAIAEAMTVPVEARMVYIMVGLSLGAVVISQRQLNQELWRNAGEIGYVMYKGEPLNKLFSVSGLREYLGLEQPQGLYEDIVSKVVAEDPARLDDWFNGSAERLALIVNILENTLRPDGIVVGGFVPACYLQELLQRLGPLPNSVVLRTDDPARIMPRLVIAQHSASSIPFGAGVMAISGRANSRFAEMIDARRTSK
ncbi:ROK family protein [Martelella limonii]|uniref:ROK family protein n=1 Tax=Martelella limonii TaxID=1647649 RepID=UPI00157FF61C|nr:ROK family protein [Martelella limonii]